MKDELEPVSEGSAMGQPLHFEAFMQSYQDMVFGTAARLLGNPTEAEDIAQEVFLKAYERFTELSQSPTAGGWLKTVTRNLCLNHLLSLIHISEPTKLGMISYAVFCLK